MSEAAAGGEALAYVDNCLDVDRRAALEARLRVDPDLRRQVDRWRAHNEAIRAAFGAPERSRSALALGRPLNENTLLRSGAGERAPSGGGGARLASPAFRRLDTARSPAPPPRAAPRRRLSGWARAGAFLTLVCAVWLATGTGGPADRRSAIQADAATAFRAFGAAGFARFDIPPGEPETLLARLGPAYARDRLERMFAMDGWTPLGARILPGLQRPAALILFENARGERGGLWIEPMEAATDEPALARVVSGVEATAWQHDGLAAAVVGPAAFGVAARLALEGAPW